MEMFSAIEALRAQVRAWRQAGEGIAFVPTMGNLHEGHLSLVRAARERAPRVVVSIYVNPTQFGPGEDLDAYPRTLEADRQRLEAEAVDLLFAPDTAVMYPRGTDVSTRVEVPVVSQGLCGDFRPGHFTGVATVVARLFNLVQPDLALFGEKDYQQLVVIRRLVEDLGWPIEIVGLPTVREADGLAMSSRNRYLDAEARARAPELYRSLKALVEAVRAGRRDYRALEREAIERLAGAGLVPEYVEIRLADSLQPAPEGATGCRVLAAARLGGARLIDNLPL
ncbi:MAG TPA: pantoate--beta-alanine ligase [Gammaproteobacteria bacterium]|nr:pantoate--beta-alanine ligase [Gammaproteobacteria bacterium]